jgi:hypothetical protein
MHVAPNYPDRIEINARTSYLFRFKITPIGGLGARRDARSSACVVDRAGQEGQVGELEHTGLAGARHEVPHTPDAVPAPGLRCCRRGRWAAWHSSSLTRSSATLLVT